ncbi:hypothetical protein MIND_00122100 [Mycena indigotica]|uniref:Glycosyltransferase n=1 Tax=Mycena indigotica TaxID=2126181 RepID=A0A8H6WKS6_9AGAR|nr:uncharacterized protein MIND_00122100 [Mycena indigotica]KAF7316044.1 hypothetical protein MIND_00122100 [Mycena indigotica]
MSTHHIATLLPPMWGHTVGYLHLSVQLLGADPTLVMSIVQHQVLVSQMEKELAGCTYDSSRLRIIGVGMPPDSGVAFDLDAYEAIFRELVMGWMQIIPELAQGSAEWPKPRTIHFDFTCGGHVIDPTKSILGPDIKTVLWYCSNAAALFVMVNECDFTAIFDKIMGDETLRAGRAPEQIQLEICSAFNGTDKLTGQIVHIPGLPDTYDYERVTLAAGPPITGWPILTSGQQLGKRVDGYIAASGSYLEPMGIPQIRKHYMEHNQTLFAVGPQTHPKYFEANATQEQITDPEIAGFLDKHSKNSVLYISFGSLFFPVATPKHVEALVETLLTLEPAFPFIFALGSSWSQAAISSSLIERVNSSGKGLICTSWVQQRAILQHDAVGWFLTHGGFNSITEAMTLGMPMIIWPVAAEQPGNALSFSSEPNPVAIELLQIRTGAQVGPSLRFGDSVNITGTVEDAVAEFKAVFAEARGAKGKMLRENAERLRNTVQMGRTNESAEEIKRLAAF